MGGFFYKPKDEKEERESTVEVRGGERKWEGCWGNAREQWEKSRW